MNKYQEVFESISDNKYQYGTDEQWELLQELVDKATPKKPVLSDNWKDEEQTDIYDENDATRYRNMNIELLKKIEKLKEENRRLRYGKNRII